MNSTAAFPVTEGNQVAEPRRLVQWLAESLDFNDEDAGRATLIATELATNLVKHAKRGEILVRVTTDGSGAREGLEIVALDAGPGMPDLAASRRDGHSTAGTLGQGLGAIQRLADFLDLYTAPTGTVIVARVCRRAPGIASRPTPVEIGAIQVSKSGEEICGDAWSWRMRTDRLAIFVADGLGHGIQAHEASEAAVRIFARVHEEPPARVIDDVHAGLRSTRGAAAAMLAVDLQRGVARYTGLGNISAAIVMPDGKRHNMVSHNGTAGVAAGKVQEFSYPVGEDAVIVMASDGLGTHWQLKSYPGLQRRSASLIAAVLYRDHSRRRDDVTVIVAKRRTGDAEKQ